MQNAITVAGQVLVIFLLIGIGVAVRKAGIVTKEASQVFSNLLVTVISPFLLINSLIRPFQKEDLMNLGFAFILAIVYHILNITITNLFIRPREGSDYRVERMAAVYSNSTFLVIPILTATLGTIGAFYAIAYITVSSVFSWTHGRINLTGRTLGIKKALLNPGTIPVYIGMFLYFTQLPLPAVITSTMASVSNINTPLAMIITGVFLADVNLKHMFTDLTVYRASLVRLIVSPAAMVLLIWVTRAAHLFPGADSVVFAHLLAASSPTAAFTVLMVSKMGLNSEHSGEIIAVSTLFSIITLPLFALLAGIV